MSSPRFFVWATWPKINFNLWLIVESRAEKVSAILFSAFFFPLWRDRHTIFIPISSSRGWPNYNARRWRRRWLPFAAAGIGRGKSRRRREQLHGRRERRWWWLVWQRFRDVAWNTNRGQRVDWIREPQWRRASRRRGRELLRRRRRQRKPWNRRKQQQQWTGGRRSQRATRGPSRRQWRERQWR